MLPRTHRPAAAAFLLAALAGVPAAAQWAVEEHPIKPGWTAVWLSLDCSYAPLDDLLAGETDIDEVWRWNTRSSTARFVDDPSTADPDVQWLVWKRGLPAETTFNLLAGNAGYLVKQRDGASPRNLSLRGRPVPPVYEWRETGLNLVGYPVPAPAELARQNWDRFLTLCAPAAVNEDVFFYQGGPLVTNVNPRRLTAKRTTAIQRGTAYWITGNAFNEVYGPLRVTVEAQAGLEFGEERVTARVRVRNLTAQAVTATLSTLPSEAPPPGQPAVAGPVPLRLRGAFDPQTGSFSYTPLTAPVDALLAAGEERDFVFELRRADLTGPAGSAYQSLLRLTDSLGLSDVRLPVSAGTAPRSGLWVGEAVLDGVNQILGNDSLPAAAPSQFAVRLLLHEDAGGQLRLLQQAYVGLAAGAPAVAARQEVLDAAALADARRFSSAFFPANAVVPGTGRLGLAGAAAFTVVLGYNAPTNPLVHQYHPDHDNLDAKFSPAPLPAGRESRDLVRQITLTFSPSPLDGADPTWGSTSLGGDYAEVVTGLRAQPIPVSGKFVLRRVATPAALLE